jgi:hypothetical protein
MNIYEDRVLYQGEIGLGGLGPMLSFGYAILTLSAQRKSYPSISKKNPIHLFL